MSLFKFKDWWSVQCSQDEHFGHNSLCVANVDNSISGSDKIIIGSLSGILRIYSVGSNTTDDGLPPFQASDLLMEMDFKSPILQVSTGLLLSATTNIQLAVLHPTKVSIYSISSTAGVTEHGSAYNILLIYEHSLKRSSFSMTLGSFGRIKGKDFISVQSLDGNLCFYEQESLAFNRFLPNALLPGAFAYLPHSDSFIVATSLWTIESYRYQVLAIANSDENNKNINNSGDNNTNTGPVKGRKVTADWTLSLGEAVIDMQVVTLEKSNNFIMVLGERCLYAIRENGSIWFMKRLEFNASCLTAYANEFNDAVMTLIGTHVSTLIIYCNDRTVWATQLPFIPIAIRRAFFPNLTGALVCLSDEGNVCCGYLGTSPSVKIVSVPNSHPSEYNYTESEAELQELRRIINSHTLEANSKVNTKAAKSDLNIEITDVQTIVLNIINTKVSNPMFKVSIKLTTNSIANNVRLALEKHSSLVAEPDIVIVPIINNKTTMSSAVNEIIIYKNNNQCPVSTRINIVVSYVNEDGAPRIASKLFHIPILIFAKPCQPLKETEHKLSIEIVNNGQPIHLDDIFADLFNTTIANTGAIGLEIYDDHSVVSLFTTIKSVNQQFVVRSETFGALAFVANELLRRLAKNHVKYDVSAMDIGFIPLNKVFAVIDDHILARYQVDQLQTGLAASTAQYRAIQKRLLIKLKDRNPTPLNNLETLLKVTQTQINGFADKLLKAITDLNNKSSHLSSAINLIFNLILISKSVKNNSLKEIHSILSTYLSNDLDEGWEERTEMCLTVILDNNGKDGSFSQNLNESQLSIPETSNTVKQLLNKLINRIFKEETINNNKESMSNRDISQTNHQKSFITTNDTIGEEVEEEEEDGDNDGNQLSIDD